MRRSRWIVLVVVAAWLVAGCSLLGFPDPETAPLVPIASGPPVGDLDRAEALWQAQAIDSYDLEVSYLCECYGGAFRFHVVDGRLASALREGKPVDLGTIGYPETIPAMFAGARSVLASGGTVRATYDAARGFPSMMTYDPIANAIDDELTIQVTGFTPNP